MNKRQGQTSAMMAAERVALCARLIEHSDETDYASLANDLIEAEALITMLAEAPEALAAAKKHREALDCMEYMPLSLKPMDNPNLDEGEHQVLDSQTGYVFKICGSRERAERIVAVLNAAYEVSR